MAAEQKRIQLESSYTPSTLGAVAAIIRDALPVSAVDLQEFIAEELVTVQAKVWSDDVESWRGFFDERMTPHEEERCRDHLILLLRQGPAGICYTPEAHIASDKEVDIGCTTGTLRIPIEVKGQWHSELWRAADKQLADQYAKDWQAGGRGIYLVLWFGDQVPKNKRLRSPGRGLSRPQTPERLREALQLSSKAAQAGQVKIVVLDLSRN